MAGYMEGLPHVDGMEVTSPADVSNLSDLALFCKVRNMKLHFEALRQNRKVKRKGGAAFSMSWMVRVAQQKHSKWYPRFEGRTTFEGTFGPWSDDKRFLPFPTTEPFEEDLMVVTHDPSDFLPPSLANRVGHYIVTPHGASVNHGGLLRDYEVFRRMVLYRAISAASQLVAAGDVDNGKGGVDLTLCLNVAFESVKAEVSPRTFTVLECPPNITELFCPSQEMNVVLKGRRLAAVHGERTVNKE